MDYKKFLAIVGIGMAATLMLGGIVWGMVSIMDNWGVLPMRFWGWIVVLGSFVGFIAALIFSFGSHENPAIGAPLYILALVGIMIGAWLIG